MIAKLIEKVGVYLSRPSVQHGSDWLERGSEARRLKEEISTRLADMRLLKSNQSDVAKLDTINHDIARLDALSRLLEHTSREDAKEALKKEVYDLLPELRGHQEPTKDEVAAWEKAIEQESNPVHKRQLNVALKSAMGEKNASIESEIQSEFQKSINLPRDCKAGCTLGEKRNLPTLRFPPGKGPKF